MNDASTKARCLLTRGIDTYTHNRDDRVVVIALAFTAAGYEHVGETAVSGLEA